MYPRLRNPYGIRNRPARHVSSKATLARREVLQCTVTKSPSRPTPRGRDRGVGTDQLGASYLRPARPPGSGSGTATEHISPSRPTPGVGKVGSRTQTRDKRYPTKSASVRRSPYPLPSRPRVGIMTYAQVAPPTPLTPGQPRTVPHSARQLPPSQPSDRTRGSHPSFSAEGLDQSWQRIVPPTPLTSATAVPTPWAPGTGAPRRVSTVAPTPAPRHHVVGPGLTSDDFRVARTARALSGSEETEADRGRPVRPPVQSRQNRARLCQRHEDGELCHASSDETKAGTGHHQCFYL